MVLTGINNSIDESLWATTTSEHCRFGGQEMERSVPFLVHSIDKFIILTNYLICQFYEGQEVTIQYIGTKIHSVWTIISICYDYHASHPPSGVAPYLHT